MYEYDGIGYTVHTCMRSNTKNAHFRKVLVPRKYSKSENAKFRIKMNTITSH